MEHSPPMVTADIIRDPASRSPKRERHAPEPQPSASSSDAEPACMKSSPPLAARYSAPKQQRLKSRAKQNCSLDGGGLLEKEVRLSLWEEGELAAVVGRGGGVGGGARVGTGVGDGPGTGTGTGTGLSIRITIRTRTKSENEKIECGGGSDARRLKCGWERERECSRTRGVEARESSFGRSWGYRCS